MLLIVGGCLFLIPLKFHSRRIRAGSDKPQSSVRLTVSTFTRRLRSGATFC